MREKLTQRYDSLGITDFHVPDIYNYLDGDGKLNGAEPYFLLAKDKLTLSSTLNTVSITVHTNLKWKTAVPAEAAGWLSILPATDSCSRPSPMTALRAANTQRRERNIGRYPRFNAGR